MTYTDKISEELSLLQRTEKQQTKDQLFQRVQVQRLMAKLLLASTDGQSG